MSKANSKKLPEKLMKYGLIGWAATIVGGFIVVEALFSKCSTLEAAQCSDGFLSAEKIITRLLTIIVYLALVTVAIGGLLYLRAKKRKAL